MEPIHIIIDTREQTPWSFDPARAVVSVGTLRTGDYALDGDDMFAIERKSFDDFLGTIGSGWARFIREIDRMRHFPAKVIIVEGCFEDCCFRYSGALIPPNHRHDQMTPQFIMLRISRLTMMGVSVLFCGNADLASAMAFQILKDRHDAITRKS